MSATMRSSRRKRICRRLNICAHIKNNGAPQFASTSPMAAGPSLPSPYYEEMRLAHIAPLRPKSVAALQDFVLNLVRGLLKELLPRRKFDLIADYAGDDGLQRDLLFIWNPVVEGG